MDNKANTEISLDGIQNQINYCDEIVDLVDKIVPKLYKVRQQGLAQKEYINDITRKLLTTGMDSTTGFEAGNIAQKKIVFADDSLGTTLVGDTWKDVSFKTVTVSQANVFNNTKEQRQVIQSLFKYKHEIGTENHFTTDQIGVAADRTHGLHLSDVKTLLTGINGLMKQSNSSPATASTDLKNILLKNIEKIDEADNRIETLYVIPQDDVGTGMAITSVSKVLISQKNNTYQTKLSEGSNGSFTIIYKDQNITPTTVWPQQTTSATGQTASIDEVSVANYQARDAQYLAVTDNKCEPASLFEQLPDQTKLSNYTSTFEVNKTKNLANSASNGVELGSELANPWSSRHKYVGFGLGD